MAGRLREGLSPEDVRARLPGGRSHGWCWPDWSGRERTA